MSINSVVVEGRLTADPERRETANGNVVVQGRIAHNSSRKQGDEWVKEAHYFSFSVFKGTAEIVAKFRKGQLVVVSGKLQFRDWEDAEGKKRSAVDIVAFDVMPVDTDKFKKSEGGEQASAGATEAEETIPW